MTFVLHRSNSSSCLIPPLNSNLVVLSTIIHSQQMSLTAGPSMELVESATPEPQTPSSEPISTETTQAADSSTLKEEKTEVSYPDDWKKCPQPPAAEIQAYGIKIRDFAYESTLPPLPSYKYKPPPPNPMQIQRQPDPRTWVGLVGAGSGPSGRQPSRLETDGLARQRGFIDLDDFTESQQSDFSSPSYSQSQPPLVYMDSQSQDSEPFVETPVVTPNGSLQWKDTSHIPTEELDVLSRMSASIIRSPKRLAEYSEPEAELTLPQLSSPSPSEQSSIRLASAAFPVAARPTKRQRLTPPESPSPPKRGTPTIPPSSASTSTHEPSDVPLPTSPPSQSPRYHLRTRRGAAPESAETAPSPSHLTTGKRPSRMRGTFSVQSTQSKTPAKKAGNQGRKQRAGTSRTKADDVEVKKARRGGS